MLIRLLKLLAVAVSSTNGKLVIRDIDELFKPSGEIDHERIISESTLVKTYANYTDFSNLRIPIETQHVDVYNFWMVDDKGHSRYEEIALAYPETLDLSMDIDKLMDPSKPWIQPYSIDDDNAKELDDLFGYFSMCRGRNIKNQIREKLTCRLDNRGEPYLYLQPIKVEDLARKPYVGRFHDVISDAESRELMEHARGQMHLSETMGLEFEDSWQRRNSETFWLPEEDSALAKRLNKRVEMIFGFDVIEEDWTAENLQIVRYTKGKYFMPHVDADGATPELEQLGGRRLATIMFYLNDVDAGGATVFTNLGLSVDPIKGSAVYWESIYETSELISESEHGGCPVVRGEKWIANKWIRSQGQIFTRPCGLHPPSTSK